MNIMGKISIVGVGPGDEGLITLKALERLKEAETIFAPIGRRGGESRALSIVSKFLSPKQEIRKLYFPMVKDETIIEEHDKLASFEILKEAQEDKKVVFLCIGDPFLYGTGGRLIEFLKDKQVELEVIPGVTSLSTASASSLVPLAIGSEKVAIFPLAYGLSGLREIISTCETVVIVKPTNFVKETILMAENLGKDVFCFKEGKMVRAKEVEEGQYFSLLIIRGKG
jgi:precorrin-2/cobalt-factor-2 C20-methyltransferase